MGESSNLRPEWYYTPHSSSQRAKNFSQAAMWAMHDILLVVLEAAQMLEARASLVKAWPKFKSVKDGLRHTDEDHEYQDCEHRARPGGPCVTLPACARATFHTMLRLFDCESKGAVRRNWSTSFQEATGTGSNAVRLIRPPARR
jgi:hypothetical protein